MSEPSNNSVTDRERDREASTASQASETVKKQRPDLSGLRPSRLLDRFAHFLYVLVTGGFFGTLFTSYSREEAFFKRVAEKRKKQKRVHLQPRYTDHRVASVIESVFFTAPLKKLRYMFMKAPIGYYADAVMAYALVSLLANFLVLFLSGAPSIYEGYALSNYALEALQSYVRSAVFAVNVILFALIAVFTFPIRSHSLEEVKSGSLFLSSFFERLLGAKSELEEELGTVSHDEKRTLRRNRAVRLTLMLIGAATGVLSAFVSPFYALLVIALLLLAFIVIRTPEAGLVLSVLLMPVLAFAGRYDQFYLSSASGEGLLGVLSSIGVPTLFLAGLVLFTGLSYLIKVLRKKRLFRFGLLDAFVLLFGALTLLYGIYPNTTAESVTEAVLTFVLMLVYLLSVNLLRNEAWIDRVLAVLQFTLFVALTAGIAVYFIGVPDLGWFPTEHITGEKGNIAALFGGEEVLSVYLVMMLPISLGTVFSVRSAACKIFAAMCLPEILFVGALLPSKLPLSFCLAGICVFALFSTYKTLYAAPLAACGAGVVYQLFPNETSLTVYLKGYLKRNFGQGIYLWGRFLTTPYAFSSFGEGFGNRRYDSLLALSDPMVDAGFWMRLLIGMGIPGVLEFLTFLFVFFQMCLEELRLSHGSRLRIELIGVFSALVILLPFGSFMPLFTDFRVTFLFWLFVGLSAALCRVSSEGRNDRSFFRADPTSDRRADAIVY